MTVTYHNPRSVDDIVPFDKKLLEGGLFNPPDEGASWRSVIDSLRKSRHVLPDFEFFQNLTRPLIDELRGRIEAPINSGLIVPIDFEEQQKIATQLVLLHGGMLAHCYARPNEATSLVEYSMDNFLPQERVSLVGLDPKRATMGVGWRMRSLGTDITLQAAINLSDAFSDRRALPTPNNRVHSTLDSVFFRFPPPHKH